MAAAKVGKLVAERAKARASRPSCLTAAAISTTAVWQSSGEGAREGGLEF